MPSALRFMPDMTFQYMDGHRYQLIKRLGAGSYGVVYRARERDPRSGKYVTRAIKVVPVHREGKSTTLREISMHSKVTGHHNIVGLHRAFQEGSYLYIVMDLLEGGDLHSHVNNKRTFSRNDALIKDVFLQILDGVEACHKQGVYHRDLKPENIFISSDLSRVCIGDFGLSTFSTESKSFNTGSRYYMCPECVDCDDELYPYSTLRADMWALGVILLNMVTGYIGWQTATIHDKQFRRFLEEEDNLLGVFPISKELNTILRRVFTIIPKDALTLSQLRREVRNVKTFYMSEEDRRAAPQDVEYMWNWYSSPASPVNSDESTDSEGGWDSWTESESDDSMSGEFCNCGMCDLPEVRIIQGPVSEPLLRRSPRALSSDEFPIRCPATRRAQLPPVSSSPSSSSSSSSSDSPITPETRPQDPPEIITCGPIEPFMLEGPVLCYGKDSKSAKEKGSVKTLHELACSFAAQSLQQA
ncbi:kinase-like protein [Trametes coccinea BRFM310]|uniref:non-specific serine/threonine protein kinase n=1 Tax=Trametes coccinea (strain BRFM310) TaxID=1353009 RepID=A0A1Y2J5K4_TRAC3|nr:kinase-like protein [Trametes coccinea BRFM310]